MSPGDVSTLKDFYNALRDQPLYPEDPVYVPYLERSGSDPIATIADGILWTEAASVSLLSGMRGTGKSTELRRLKRRLEDAGCIVFLGGMQDYLNLTKPIEITDFLVSIMGALSEEVRLRFGDDLVREDYWTRFANFLKSEVKVAGFSIEAPVAEAKVGLRASLKTDPTFKQDVQKALRGHVARIVEQAHGYAAEVVKAVRGNSRDPNTKVVFLADSLEQIRGVGVEEADEVHRSVENLFCGHAESLHIPLLHMVYTLPPYLSSLTPGTGRLLGGGVVQSIPSIHVRDRDGNPDPKGIGIMREIVSARFPNWSQVFSEPQVERMARSTGGDLRDFFRMMKLVLLKRGDAGVLPLSDALVERAEKDLQREMLPIAADDAKWLHRIAQTKRPELDKIVELPRLARFFDNHVVLNYRNDDDWYDVHPLLADEVSRT
jgi:hypothetical protein